MSILDKLETASFREIPFLVPDETSARGGRKKVVHEFINSDRRAVEDQGAYQDVYRIKGIITDSDGQYFERRNALINALKRPDAGILSHPFFGKISVIPDKYALRQSFSELGRADFDITFYRAEEKVEPLPDAFTEFNVEAAQETVVECSGRVIVDAFKVSRKYPFNFTASVNTLDKIAAAFDSATRTFQRQLNEIDAFSQSLRNFRNSILRLVQLPNQLVASLNNLFDSALDLAATPEEAFLTLEKFFPFGDDDPFIPQTTFERIEKLRNRTLLNQYIQVGALALAYNQAADIDFFTIREIDVYAGKLNAQYDKVYPNLTNNHLASELANLRTIANEFLDRRRLNVKRIVAFETGPTTIQALNYSLYGNLDDAERLAALNGVKDTDFVSGTLELFR